MFSIFFHEIPMFFPWFSHHGMDALGSSGDPGLALKAGEERNGGEWRSGAIQATERIYGL